MTTNQNPDGGSQTPAGTTAADPAAAGAAATTPPAAPAPGPAAAPAPAQSPAPDASPAPAPADAAPAEYTAFTATDGRAIDKAIADEVVATAKALGLTQEKAQTLYDSRAASAAAASQAIQTQRETVIGQWRDASQADPEIGGANAQTTAVDMQKALDQLGTPALTEALKAFGLDQHPDMRRLLSKVGKQLRPDTGFHAPSAPAPARSRADRMYDGK